MDCYRKFKTSTRMDKWINKTLLIFILFLKISWGGMGSVVDRDFERKQASIIYTCTKTSAMTMKARPVPPAALFSSSAREQFLSSRAFSLLLTASIYSS